MTIEGTNMRFYFMLITLMAISPSLSAMTLEKYLSLEKEIANGGAPALTLASAKLAAHREGIANTLSLLRTEDGSVRLSFFEACLPKRVNLTADLVKVAVQFEVDKLDQSGSLQLPGMLENQVAFHAMQGLSLMFRCTSSATTERKSVASDRLFAFRTASAASDATLVVSRDTGLYGSGCFKGFVVGNKLAARFAVGETAIFYLPPGEKLIHVGVDPQGSGLCGLGQGYLADKEIILRSGEIKHVRLTVTAEGHDQIQ